VIGIGMKMKIALVHLR